MATMNDPCSDAQDIADMQRLATGRDTALNDLMERHSLRLFHYLLRQLQDENKARDLAQETFVKVYLHRLKFRAEAKFSTWLYAIATNLVRDHLRWRERHPEVSLEAQETNRPSWGEILPDTQQTPPEALASEEYSEQVRKAVQSLPADLRTPLLLFEYEDLSQDEIAKALSCSRKTVEMRIYHARQKLRQTLSHLAKDRP